MRHRPFDKTYFVGICFTIFLCLLASRRWCQLISPQVWDEDGTSNPFRQDGINHGSNIANYINDGFIALFSPVNDYLIMVPKIISGISLGISFSAYPIVSTIITWVFIAFVGLAITFAPTKLRGRFFCALAVFFIPSDPKVFGLPLYTFWWATLLLFLVALWDESDTDTGLGWRVFFLVIAGLSTPVVIVVVPLLYIRAYLYRAFKYERLLALLGTLVAIIQGYFILIGPERAAPSINSIITNIIPSFFGKFLIGNFVDNKIILWVAALGLLVLICTLFVRNQKKITSYILLYLLFATIALAAIRVDPAFIHPKFAGPRYFFFPFILIYWFLIHNFYLTQSTILRAFIGASFLSAILNAIPAWSRQHDDLYWSEHVRSCQFFPEYSIPIHFDGNEASTWFLRVSGESCKKLLAQDMLISKYDLASKVSFPFTVNKKVSPITHSQSYMVVSTTMLGQDLIKTPLNNYLVFSSFMTSGSNTGETVLKMRRGDKIMYRSGPKTHNQTLAIIGSESMFLSALPSSTDWVFLEFTNYNLPDNFLVKIKDNGRQWGEWSAVAIQK